jgi:hypothetical protein
MLDARGGSMPQRRAAGRVAAILAPVLALLSLLVSVPWALLAQALPSEEMLRARPSQEAAQEPQTGALRLFLDCQASGCNDLDYFRTEIRFVNWVRDRRDADVHLLITSQTTGSGGRSYDLFFMGAGRFQEMTDTLPYVSGFDATSDEVREGLAGVMKLGLLRYVALTPAAGEIVIRMRGEEPGRPGGPGGRAAPAAGPQDDPWNFWVFRTSLSGYSSGESTYRSLSLGGSFTASRTTEDWKASLRMRTSYNESRFDYGTVSTLSVTRNHSFSGLLVKSLSDHWSAGLRGGASTSTYANHRLTLNAGPVLEYNVFPYSESTRRMLTLQYAVEGSYFDYVEETVYFKTRESVLRHDLTTSLGLTQPWGSANVFLAAGHFIRDIGQHSAGLGGSVNVRLARGFSVNLGGSVSRIQDLISVPAGERTPEDVLLRRKQLQTDYRYFTHFGLSYTFGSVYMNVVNPRIQESGGGMMIVM